jgi:hypothetical protein
MPLIGPPLAPISAAAAARPQSAVASRSAIGVKSAALQRATAAAALRQNLDAGFDASDHAALERQRPGQITHRTAPHIRAPRCGHGRRRFAIIGARR